MGDTIDNKNKVICTFCDKEHVDAPVFKGQGNNIGNSQALAKAIMEKFYGNKPARKHPLSMPKSKGSCAQAHHLICSESMDDGKWSRICSNFGYNIDCVENGVFLPADMRIACQLSIPLHRGNHSDTETDESKNYVSAVKNKIKPVKEAAYEEEYCKEGKEIIKKLNKISKNIWDKVESFVWTLTYDGKHYKGKKGCLGMRSLSKKRQINEPVSECPIKKKHKIIIKGVYFKEK